MKAILATGELGSLRDVGRASMVAMMAGSDFIKTSTGKEAVNATLPVSLVMVRAIRAYHERTGYMVGYKPAGGISKAKDALDLPHHDAGGARAALAGAGPLPLRRVVAARRHRAAARAPSSPAAIRPPTATPMA